MKLKVYKCIPRNCRRQGTCRIRQRDGIKVEKGFLRIVEARVDREIGRDKIYIDKSYLRIVHMKGDIEPERDEIRLFTGARWSTVTPDKVEEVAGGCHCPAADSDNHKTFYTKMQTIRK